METSGDFHKCHLMKTMHRGDRWWRTTASAWSI